MAKFLVLLFLLVSFSFADTYKLFLDVDGSQGNVTFVSDSTMKYTHDGSVVPTNVSFVLDSVQIHAVDAANNIGNPAWIFVKITPVNDNAPVVSSDTITVIEGGSIEYTPHVTDADN